LKKWHGRPARETTRKMRVPPQTAPLPNFTGEPVSLSNRRPEIVMASALVGLRRNRLDYTAN